MALHRRPSLPEDIERILRHTRDKLDAAFLEGSLLTPMEKEHSCCGL